MSLLESDADTTGAAGFGADPGNQNDPNIVLESMVQVAFESKQDAVKVALEHRSHVQMQCSKCGPQSMPVDRGLWSGLYYCDNVHSVQGLLSRSENGQIDSFVCWRCNRPSDTVLRTSRFTNAPPVLWLRIMTPHDPQDSSLLLRPTPAQYMYPEDVLLVPLTSGEMIPYRFAGGIFRRGADSHTGHYISAVGREQAYWVINDEKVTHKSSLEEVYREEYYPTAFFYTQDTPRE